MAWFGISNENEFYSEHYLSEIFSKDIQERITRWKEQEDAASQAAEDAVGEASGETLEKAPYTQLRTLGRDALQFFKEAEQEKTPQERLRLQRRWTRRLLEVFGWLQQPERYAVDDDIEIPLLAQVTDTQGAPLLWVLEALPADATDDDPLSEGVHPKQLESLNAASLPPAMKKGAKKQDWQNLLASSVFAQTKPPRWVILASGRQWLLLDRTKFAQGRLLRFDWLELFTRREPETLKAVSVLLHRDSLLGTQGDSGGQCLLDTLDENAHKHAYGVSEDLKYALRECIELLGNEAASQLVQRSGISFTGKSALDPDQLSIECLRYMYRLLFLFYIEARPELGYAPVDNPVYLTGYSLESLRELEMVPLTSEREQNGRYFHDSLHTLFQLIQKGYQPEPTGDLLATSADGFQMFALQSHLFDPERTRLLDKVVFPNHLLQRIIQLMSLSRPGKGRKRRGRISYAQLGINQLGAVYEALLSYRGFFASEDLYEVKKAGENPDALDTGYFVNAQELEQYNDDEKVYDNNAQGHKELRIHRKGSFIYRLAGRDREKSASYYTPEVLTQSLVKYTLKELFKEQLDPLPNDDARAKRILELRVCEPAMGSAAFLNEAIDQLADKYLELAQSARNERIPQSQYLAEKQKVKMFLADNNVFGVDLNPIAVELAEVSLWLNALSADRFIPWLGLQLNCGNSLIGARREVFPVSSLTLKPNDGGSWLKTTPKRVPLGGGNGENGENGTVRSDNQIWHFLLPDSGMANYTDKVVKARYKADIKVITDWRKAFIKSFDKDEIQRLQQISSKVDELWAEHTASLKKLRERTTDPYQIYGFEHAGQRTSINYKDDALSGELLSEKLQNASAFRRLKLAMDYWCALWFWPIDQAHLLPSRDEWLFDLENLLLGDTLSAGPAGEVPDLFSDTAPVEEGKSFVNKFGVVNLKVLFKHFPRLELADQIANSQRFFHWELAFADIFAESGGFDLMLGNPPWLKVEWQEGGILGDQQPLFVLRKFSASKLNALRDDLFDRLPSLESGWLTEYQQAEGTQNFLNASVNYPLLKGVQTNLYKCFLPQAWKATAVKGVSGFLHPEGTYDDPKGGAFREEIYPRLRSHFQFINETKLFAEVHNQTLFSVNIYASKKPDAAFSNISNLFVPQTIDQSFEHDGAGLTPGIKEEFEVEGAVKVRWNLKGHRERVVAVTNEELELFARLYDEEGTPPLRARLPALHSTQLISVLEKFAAQPKRLGDLKGQYISMEMWHETNQQKDGTIKRETRFPKDPSEWILSGPHFFVGNPLYNTPKAVCNTNKAYDSLDLTNLPEDYLPRTNYVPACSPDEYRARTPKVPWVDLGNKEPKIATEYYRLAIRKMLSQSGERTLIAAVIPRWTGHIDGATSLVFSNPMDLLAFAGASFSIPFDFWVKTTGKANFRQELQSLMPIFATSLQSVKEVVKRVLQLNCLTENYRELWNSVSGEIGLDSWEIGVGIRRDYARRLALLEIDVLIAQLLKMSLSELIAVYRVQFPVMRQYEAETFYDQNGRIVFTPSKGLVGVGLPRKAKKAELKNDISYTLKPAEGEKQEGIALGWEDIKDLPAGSKVIKTFMDDTLPGGSQRRSIEYVAPFIKPDREKDYEIAWRVFEARKRNQ
ncbi:Eco57I restriction-modification methylase domain-containing protein [Microbulbifer sp. JTAC008]|uniref:Eco57I restriction-modification methylase domain-containing protein n=1 Tax=unclassified Microbulbifer TaxID=2619833 RepID=UPI004039FBA4